MPIVSTRLRSSSPILREQRKEKRLGSGFASDRFPTAESVRHDGYLSESIHLSPFLRGFVVGIVLLGIGLGESVGDHVQVLVDSKFGAVGLLRLKEFAEALKLSYRRRSSFCDVQTIARARIEFRSGSSSA